MLDESSKLSNSEIPDVVIQLSTGVLEHKKPSQMAGF
jgi:hypothetical protein